MSKSNNGVKKTDAPVKAEAVFVEIKKTRNVRHNAPISFEGYTKPDGTARQVRFYEGEEGFKTYGAKVSNIRVDDAGLTLNLSNPLDLRKYEVAKEMEQLGIFPFEAQEPLLQIVEPDVEDNNAVSQFDNKLKAMNILAVELADPNDLRNFAFYFGLSEGKDTTVKRNMIDLAEKSPEQFIEGWNDEFRHLMVLTRKAIDKGLISLRADTNIYSFGDKVLGMNHNEIVNTLALDTPLVAVLNSKV